MDKSVKIAMIIMSIAMVLIAILSSFLKLAIKEESQQQENIKTSYVCCCCECNHKEIDE